MVNLRQFEKRLNALGAGSKTKASFVRLTQIEIRAVRLIAWASGRAHPERGQRVLPPDWQGRMPQAVWQAARDLQGHHNALLELWTWFDRAFPGEPTHIFSNTHQP